MRKTLLTIGVAAVAASAFAMTPLHQELKGKSNLLKGRAPVTAMDGKMALRKSSPATSRAEGDQTLSMDWGYCDEPYNAFPFLEGELKVAIVMPEELTTSMAGSVMSSVSIGNPIDLNTQTPNYELMVYEYENPIKDVTVWLSEGLDKEPFMSFEGQLGEDGFQWSTIDMPEPYTIEGGKQLVIGYTLQVPENEDGAIFPLITDGFYDGNPDGCQVYSTFSKMDAQGQIYFGDEYKWQNMGQYAGYACLRVMLTGDNLPVNKALTIASQGPTYAAPGEDFEFLTYIQNRGANPISSVEYTMEIEGMEPQAVTVPVRPAIATYEYSDILAPLFKSTTVGNNIPYKCYMSGVNGVKLEKPGAAVEGYFLCIEEGYPKNNVFEEATGTWCGWCVVGYAGMEAMAKEYPDYEGFIGIAVHGDDPMDVMGEGMAYEAFGNYVEGFPSAYANRDMLNALYPSPEDFEDEMYYIGDIPAYAKISATLEQGESEDVLKLSTVTEFGDSEEEADYMVAYAVLEDEVGPYRQVNYCSGSDEDYYGFENKAERIMLKFNDVARNCSQPMGIANSLPTSFEEGEQLPFDTEITLTDVKNYQKVRVVAMVVNGTNGAIENAVCVKSPEYVGVKSVVASQDDIFAYGVKGALNFRVNGAKANVFSIDGRCVAAGVKSGSIQLPAGIYIVELNGKTCKVVVR